MNLRQDILDKRARIALLKTEPEIAEIRGKSRAELRGAVDSMTSVPDMKDMILSLLFIVNTMLDDFEGN